MSIDYKTLVIKTHLMNYKENMEYIDRRPPSMSLEDYNDVLLNTIKELGAAVRIMYELKQEEK
jgi:hypothetical protein